jgi:hypothetical protein
LRNWRTTKNFQLLCGLLADFLYEIQKICRHQVAARFGALRIGTLRDHESVAAAIALDAGWRCKVARNRKLPNSPSHVVAHKYNI